MTVKNKNLVITEASSNCCGGSVDIDCELCLSCFEHCGIEYTYESDIHDIFDGFMLAQDASNQAIRNALKGKVNK
jgi:hypothetical protein